ncbi:MAG: lamin tail domain-containing protein, partial [Candidatus Latescibacterota bacterium]
VGPPPLVISEVMSHPQTGCPEYIELFNRGSDRYDLTGHSFRDAAHPPAPITAAVGFVEPGGFAVVTSDADALRKRFPEIRGTVVGVDGSWPSLNHSGNGDVADSVVVLDGVLLTVDRVGYPPQPSATIGRSLERVDLYASSGPAIWVLSNESNGGSPGWRHAESLLNEPEGLAVRASPNPFDPWRSENLFVTVPEQDTPSRVVLTVFDLEGRRVRDVGATTDLPTVMTWDGTGNDGHAVGPGFYIVACEFSSLVTSKKRVEKVVVGCAKTSSH